MEATQRQESATLKLLQEKLRLRRKDPKSSYVNFIIILNL